MNTPAISNLLNLGSNPAPTKSSGASSEAVFNQVLSREMEGHRSVNEPSKPVAKESRPAAQAARPAPKSNESDAAAADRAAPAAEANAAPAAPAAAAPAAERSKADDAAGAENESDEAALAASSDELLALVANLNQAAFPAQAAQDAKPVDRVKQDADAAPAVIGAPEGDALAAAAAALHAAAPTAPATDTAQAVGEGDAKPRLTLGKQPAAIAADVEKSGQAKESDISPAQAADAKPALDMNAAHAESAPKEFAGVMQSASEPRAAKAVHDAQPAAAQVAPFQFAAQQQAPLQQAQQAAAAAAADKLAPRVGSSGWDQALGQKVVWMVAGEQQSASLTLNPPDLGPLQVVLNVSNNQATVNFTAAQPEVRQALESAVPKLREMLGDAGIQLGQANVSAGTPNNQQGGFGERQQGQASRGTGPRDDGVIDTPVRVGRSQVITGGQGMVDTFA